MALFVQRGYDKVSLNDLIADAGVSKGAFYHWFPSKEALIAALAERSANEQRAAVENALAVDRILGVADASITVLTRAQVEAMVEAVPRNH